MSQKFEAYKTQYNKSYSPEEHEVRFKIFQDNHQKIEEHNNKNLSWTMEPNELMDLTGEEFEQKYLTPINDDQLESKPEKDVEESEMPQGPPSSWNWQDRIQMNVKAQKNCGACWAFATIAAVEALITIKYGRLYSFSEQCMVDCDKDNNGCGGGNFLLAYEFIRVDGLPLTDKYTPYMQYQQSCKSFTRATRIDDYWRVPVNNDYEMQKRVHRQPPTVAVHVDNDKWQFYGKGVIDYDCSTSLNHGIIINGYTPDYWIIKNSWGTSWGHGGFGKIKRYQWKNSEGMCGILKYGSFPEYN